MTDKITTAIDTQKIDIDNVNNEFNPFKDEDWYQLLVDDCRAIFVERVYRCRMEVIECKWEIGERIVTDPNYKKLTREDSGKIKGQSSFIKYIAKDIGISRSDAYYCVQFYESQQKVQKIEKPELSNVLDNYDKSTR